MTNRIWVSLVLLLGMACTPPETTVTRLSKNTYPSKPYNCDIQILTQAPTNRKFDEIAILNTIAYEQFKAPFSSVNDKDLDAMLPSIKATACKLGADAVIIRTVDPGSKNVPLGKAYTAAIKFID